MKAAGMASRPPSDGRVPMIRRRAIGDSPEAEQTDDREPDRQALDAPDGPGNHRNESLRLGIFLVLRFVAI